MPSSNVILAAVGVFAVLNVVLVILLYRTRTRKESIGTEPFHRIAQRLEMLDDISGNLTDLSRLFLVPHARGGVGETLLNELLHTWLPAASYQTQYQFASGSRADAIIRLHGSIVAVDAKFPLEQVRPILESTDTTEIPGKISRVFMKHIEDIAAKYIRPDEGTLEFALMYLPSEALYYRAFVDNDGSLMSDAVSRGVVPAGPSSLFLYLQTVAFGLRGLGLTGRERELTSLIRQLNHDFGQVTKSFETTANHLRNAAKNSDDLSRLLRKHESLLDRLSGS